MSVETEQDRQDMLSMDDFGATFVLPTGSEVACLFDRSFSALDIGIESTEPSALITTLDGAGLAEGDPVTIAHADFGSGSYIVKSVQPDGSGFSQITLIEA